MTTLKMYCRDRKAEYRLGLERGAQIGKSNFNDEIGWPQWFADGWRRAIIKRLVKEENNAKRND